MLDIPHSAIAAFTGFLSGLLLSIPVGPINLTIDSSSITRLAVHFDQITPALQAKLKAAIEQPLALVV